jgi:predicted ArsR family transcriptional regulator
VTPRLTARLVALLGAGPATRADLARRIAVTEAAVVRAARDAEGVVVEGDVLRLAQHPPVTVVRAPLPPEPEVVATPEVVERPAPRPPSLRERILAHLGEMDLTSAELADRLGEHPQAVRDALRALRDEERVWHVGRRATGRRGSDPLLYGLAGSGGDLSQMPDRIERVLADVSPSTAHDLADALRVPRSRVMAAVSRMLRDGRVVVVDHVPGERGLPRRRYALASTQPATRRTLRDEVARLRDAVPPSTCPRTEALRAALSEWLRAADESVLTAAAAALEVP